MKLFSIKAPFSYLLKHLPDYTIINVLLSFYPFFDVNKFSVNSFSLYIRKSLHIYNSWKANLVRSFLFYVENYSCHRIMLTQNYDLMPKVHHLNMNFAKTRNGVPTTDSVWLDEMQMNLMQQECIGRENIN